MHEDLSRKEEIEGASDRSFGLVMAAFFLLVGLAPLFHENLSVRWWALAIAAVFLLLALFWTRPLAPLNILWFKLGLALFVVVSPVVLGLLFYLTFMPVGLAMRLSGKDPLRLQRDAGAESYWIERKPPGPAPESMKNQF